jgi:hypothetical protein
MERILPATEFFDSARPAVQQMPHLLMALDVELIGKIAHLTGSAPGIWELPAPYDEEDRFDNMREEVVFTAWGLPLNQGEVLSFSPLVQEALFGGKTMFVDSSFDQGILSRLAVSPGHRAESGAWVTRGYQDLPELRELVEQCGWVLIPVGPARSQALFIARAAQADWIPKLQEWCAHDGRNHGQFRFGENGLCLAEQWAPEQYRQNALNHQVDAFLSRLEIYFGTLDQPLAPVLEARLAVRRELKERLLASKPPPANS